MYPNATIWMVGHSVRKSFFALICHAEESSQLGGAVSGLIGLSFGAPVVTFEAPGERLAARRLHLPLPPGMPSDKTGITHIYHTADPIPMGTCTGTYSGCYAAGFVRAVPILSAIVMLTTRRLLNRNVIPAKQSCMTQLPSRAGLSMSAHTVLVRSSTKFSWTLGRGLKGIRRSPK